MKSFMRIIMHHGQNCDHLDVTNGGGQEEGAHIWVDGPHYPNEMRGGCCKASPDQRASYNW